MIGIVITGHGLFGTGMYAGLEMIGGKYENLDFLDFQNDIDYEQLEKMLEQKLDNMTTCNEFVFLTDLAGGSPFKSAVSISLKRPNVHVISGLNMPTLLSLILSRTESVPVRVLIENTLSECRDTISYLDLMSSD